MKLLAPKEKTKPDTTEFPFFYYNLLATFEETTENKGEDTGKNQSENKKSNIFFTEQLNITAQQKKDKRNHKDDKKKPIILRSVIFQLC